MTAALAALGLVIGAVLPRVVALIPDRVPADGESEPTPHRDLAEAPRLPVVLGLVTAGVWALIGVAGIDTAALPAYLAVGALGVAMSYVDLRDHRLPDWLTLPALGVAGVGLAVAAAATDQWAWFGRAWLAAAACFVFYLILALLRPADLGLGDVKLAAVVGLLLGWAGWQTVTMGVFSGFMVGGVVAIVLLTTRQAGRHSSIPFGPPMLLGALIALVWV